LSQFTVKTCFKLQKVDKSDAYGIRDEKHDLTISLFLKLQMLFTENRDIAQKNSFRYHNLVFMLNLIL